MSENPNVLDPEFRKKLIQEIEGEENISRKRAEQRRLDIYRNRHMPYVIEKLQQEFSAKSIQDMRKVLSINPCPKIIDEMASIYTNEPERHFSDTSENEQEQIDNLYEINRVNVALKQANQYFKLSNQCALWVVPKDQKIMVRALTPKDYDVVPDVNNPEKAYAYIISSWDKLLRGTVSNFGLDPKYNQNDSYNQNIADVNDDRDSKRYAVWTAEYHYVMDGYGNIIGEAVNNPIGRLPFIDVCADKDHTFFVQSGSNVPEFTIDFLSQLSDLANVSRLQGYSQAIVSSSEEPTDLNVGPNKVLWLKQDPNNSNAAAKFEFASPSPDLSGSLEILNSQLKIFLSSLGLNVSTITANGTTQTFSSGLDHLLAQIDKFTASKQDMSLFRWIEIELFDLLRLWSNEMQSVAGEGELVPELKLAQISEDINMTIKFSEPSSITTNTEKETSVTTRLDKKLLSRKGAIMELYGVDEDKAKEMLQEIDEESKQRIEENQDNIQGDNLEEKTAKEDAPIDEDVEDGEAESNA